jgi:NtrC-family two-component system response regulator AlgB
LRKEPENMALKILVVDDEPGIRRTLKIALEDEGHVVTAASGSDSALAAIDADVFDLVFLDLRLGTASGLDLLPAILEAAPWTRVVVVTAYATIETAVEAMRRGAWDYLAKPFTPEQVRLVASRIAEIRRLESRLASLEEDAERGRTSPILDCPSPAMRALVETARRVAETDATILLTGESGTGKGILARAIHGWSPRAERPFVIIHCPSLPTELLESELFGHARGAFTGATETTFGRVAQAEGGTLFLDEIGELPPPLQPKLLRFLQDHEYERVGDPVTRHADVRIVAATNRDLGAQVEAGHFREDLFYRLNVFPLDVPPLRRRTEDVVPLASAFLVQFARRYGRRAARLGAGATASLLAHDWPGNVRELENAIERAVILSHGEELDALPLGSTGQPPAPGAGGALTLAALEEAHIRRVLARSASLDEAARTLGIDPSTLYRKRRDYGLA